MLTDREIQIYKTIVDGFYLHKSELMKEMAEKILELDRESKSLNSSNLELYNLSESRHALLNTIKEVNRSISQIFSTKSKSIIIYEKSDIAPQYSMQYMIHISDDPFHQQEWQITRCMDRKSTAFFTINQEFEFVSILEEKYQYKVNDWVLYFNSIQEAINALVMHWFRKAQGK